MEIENCLLVFSEFRASIFLKHPIVFPTLLLNINASLMEEIEKKHWLNQQKALIAYQQFDLANQTDAILEKVGNILSEEEKTNRIQVLNDSLRIAGVGGQILVTRGIYALSQENQQRAIRAIQTFNDFNEDNDPYHEHDCAIVGDAMFKIDYYHQTLDAGSESPECPIVTKRVMTILTTSEY